MCPSVATSLFEWQEKILLFNSIVSMYFGGTRLIHTLHGIYLPKIDHLDQVGPARQSICLYIIWANWVMGCGGSRLNCDNV